jgi:tryptophanyl-tRNA synthetase
MQNQETILTGLRVNNNLHIGNYLGAIRPIVDMSNSNIQARINLFVPDLHSITTEVDYSKIQQTIINNIKIYIASGLPVEKSNVYIYRQSYISAHSELTWILECFSGFGELSRMIEFKEKSEQIGKSNVGVGLFNYPVLMASDILLYDAEYVPVGDDQRQHLEFCRNIASKFNNKFGDIFTVPKNSEEQHKKFLRDQAPRIKDLTDPSKKMSKSATSEKGVIFLNDDIEIAKNKIKSATTDSLGKINYDHVNQPGISNLIDIYSMLSEISKEEILNKYKESENYAAFKNEVAEAVGNFLNNFQSRLSDVDSKTIQQKLESSEKDMNQYANKTLLKVQKAVGLR